MAEKSDRPPHAPPQARIVTPWVRAEVRACASSVPQYRPRYFRDTRVVYNVYKQRIHAGMHAGIMTKKMPDNKILGF